MPRDLPDHPREYRVRIVPAERAGPTPRPPDDLGLRTKFGGVPDAIQDADPVQCSGCFRPMHFVAQLDSFEHKGERNPRSQDYPDQPFMFGDVGMIYVYFCFACLTPHATLQSY